MDKWNDPAIYRVVKYFETHNAGLIEEVLAEHLTLESAKELAFQNRPMVAAEEIVVENETERAAGEAEVFRVTSDQPRSSV